MKKYFQCKLERTGKSRISSPHLRSQSGDCFSELQEKTMFICKDWWTRAQETIIVLPEIRITHWEDMGKKGNASKNLLSNRAVPM